MAIGTPSFTRSAIDSPTADFAKTLSAFGTNMMAQAKQDEELKLQRERQAVQDARQVIADAQNKQLFDLKIEDANRAKQDLVDKDAYLKGIVNPNAYGLKAGTEDAVNSLGSYGDDARSQAAIAAGPGSAEYEAHFKNMENLGNYITGKSLDDRTIGFATANPNNRYAAEEAIKASIARQNTLDKEAKDIADNQLKYQLESLKQLGKGSTGVSEDGTSTSKVGMTAGGYKVSSPDDVLKDANTIMKDNYGLKSDSPMDARVVKLASRMSNAGYSASQIAEVIGTNYTPGKVEKLFGYVDILWPDKAPVFNDIAPNVGAPKNVAVQPATNTAYTDTLSGLSQSYADRLAKIQEQRDGTYGMDKFRELLNGTTQVSADYTEKGKTASGSSPKYANVKSIDGVPQHLVNSEGVTTESYKDGKGYSIAMGYNLHANKNDITKDFTDANISADKINIALNNPEKLVLTDEEATRLSQLSTYKYIDSADNLLKKSGLEGGFDSLSPQMQDMALQMRYRGDLDGDTQYGKDLLRLVKNNDLTQLSSYINSNRDNLPKEVVTRFNNALDNPSKTGLRGTMTDADKNAYLVKNSNSEIVNRILGLGKKEEEEKKVEEKTPDEVLKTEINTALEEVNAKLQKQFDEGKMSPFNNTLRKLGLHADQKAVETKAIGDSIKAVVEKATDTIQSADNIDSDKLRQDPNVLMGYEKAKKEKYQAVGYTGMGTPFEYTVDDYIKEIATGKKFDYKDIEKRTKAEEARVNEIKSNPDVVKEYRKILNEMARREGYIGTSAMPNYSIEQFIKDMKIQ